MTTADIVYRNGAVFVVDADFTIASALAIADGVILAAGTDADMEMFVGPRTVTIDVRCYRAVRHETTAGDIE